MDKKVVFRGDTISGVLALYIVDELCEDGDDGNRKPFIVPDGSSIQVLFPGGVSISSDAGEVSVDTTEKWKIAYKLASVKSPNMKLGIGAIDVIVVDPDSNKKTFEKAKSLDVRDRAN